jgi:hypothetical protein
MYANEVVYMTFKVRTRNHKKNIEQEIHNDWSQIVVGDNNYDNQKFLLILEGFVGKCCSHVMDM